jgi:hypothetical protein
MLIGIVVVPVSPIRAKGRFGSRAANRLCKNLEFGLVRGLIDSERSTAHEELSYNCIRRPWTVVDTQTQMVIPETHT